MELNNQGFKVIRFESKFSKEILSEQKNPIGFIQTFIKTQIDNDLKDDEWLKQELGVTKEEYDLENVEYLLPVGVEEGIQCFIDCDRDALSFSIDVKIKKLVI